MIVIRYGRYSVIKYLFDLRATQMERVAHTPTDSTAPLPGAQMRVNYRRQEIDHA